MNKKRVLISGAGRGLGRAIAYAFLEAGYFVIATDIDPDLLSDLASTKNVLTFQLDVSSEEEMADCAMTIGERFGGIDVLVSNAGIFDFYPVAEAGVNKLNKLFDVNVFGLANLSKYFLPLLIKSAGRLIVISSESYKIPAPFQPYAVSKQALEAVYKSIKMELSVKNIKCVLIRPGAIQTTILETVQTFTPGDDKGLLRDEFQSFIQTVPKYMGKASEPAEVARLVLKAAKAKRPKAVYAINHHLLVSLLSYLPVRLKEFVVRKSLK